MTGLDHLVRGFAGVRVAVVGDAMLDRYLDGTSERLCREAPVPIVGVERALAAPGAAANAAANLRSLGAEVALLSLAGDDEAGRELRQTLDERGVDAASIFIEPGRETLTKTRVLSGGQLLVRFDRGTTQPPPNKTEQDLAARLGELFRWADAVLISDYGYGVLSHRVIQALAALQREAPRLVTLDAKLPRRFHDVGVTAVKPNYAEAVRLLGEPALDSAAGRAQQMAGQAERLLRLCGARMAAITLDAEGAVVCEVGGEAYRTYASPVANSRASGAGDTFLAAFTLGLAAGGDMRAAAELASAAAAIVVQNDGTATCDAAGLIDYLAGSGKFATDWRRLADSLELARRRGARVVFTNGCFDLLHSGHVGFLNQAKALGDKLVVALNTDAGAARLKGPGRPIHGLTDRIQVLSALSSVDHIVAFDDDRPDRLIELLRPHVFVKGADYTRGMLPEAGLVERLGGRIELLPFEAGQSTHELLRRIRQGAA